MFFLLYSYFSYFQQNIFTENLHTVENFTRSENTETIFQGNTKKYFPRITN